MTVLSTSSFSLSAILLHYTHSVLTGPTGLSEATRSFGLPSAEDDVVLRRVLKGLTMNLSNHGVATQLWSVNLRRYGRMFGRDEETLEMLKQVARGIRAIDPKNDQKYKSVALQTCTKLKREGSPLQAGAIQYLANHFGDHPRDFVFQAWMESITLAYAEAAEHYGIMADRYRMQGDLTQAKEYYLKEATAYLKDALYFAKKKKTRDLQKAQEYFASAAYALQILGEEEKALDARKKMMEMEAKVAALSMQPNAPSLKARLSKGIEFVLRNAAAGVREHPEITSAQARAEAATTKKGGPSLRIVK